MNHTPALAPSESLAGFAALLRDHGLRVGVAEQQAMLQAALRLRPLLGSGLRIQGAFSSRHSFRLPGFVTSTAAKASGMSFSS